MNLIPDNSPHISIPAADGPTAPQAVTSPATAIAKEALAPPAPLRMRAPKPLTLQADLLSGSTEATSTLDKIVDHTCGASHVALGQPAAKGQKPAGRKMVFLSLEKEDDSPRSAPVLEPPRKAFAAKLTTPITDNSSVTMSEASAEASPARLLSTSPLPSPSPSETFSPGDGGIFDYTGIDEEEKKRMLEREYSDLLEMLVYMPGMSNDMRPLTKDRIDFSTASASEKEGEKKNERMAACREFAAEILTDSSLDLSTLEDDHVFIKTDDNGIEHKLRVMAISPDRMVLTSNICLGSGQNKEVCYALEISSITRKISERAVALPDSRAQDLEYYSRSARQGIVGPKWGADKVIANLLSFEGKDNLAGATFVQLKKGHLAFGAVVYPFMNKGTYLELFRTLRADMLAGSETIEKKDIITQQVTHLMRDAVNGLCQIHEKGLVHGDIKPANIMAQIDEEGQCRGYVTDLDGMNTAEELTNIMRTAAYLPLQHKCLKEEEGYDWHKDDVWSLGASFVDLLTGESQAVMTLIKDPVWFDPDKDIEPFQDQLKEKLEEKIPNELLNKAEIIKLLVEMLSVVGTTRPTMAQVRERLDSLMS